MAITRRLFAAVPFALLAFGRRADAADACVDLDALPPGQKNLRTALAYQIVSPDPNKQCGTCSFYTAAAGVCGKCKLFADGPVAANSVCKSWAPKPKKS